MNEIQRQQYLDALGVDSYMPRWILPLAPAPQACAPVIPTESGPDTPPVSMPVGEGLPSRAELPGAGPAAAAPASSASAASAAVTTASSAISSPTASSAVPADESAGRALAAISEVVRSADVKQRPTVSGVMPKTEAVTDPRFALSLWRVSDKLLVVDSRHAELALPTEPLLTNILTALGLPRTPLPKADVLRWPMYDYPLAPKGDDAARDTILAMLEGRLEMEPVEYVLLMGAEACHYVLPPELLPATAETGDDASLAAARSPGLSAVDSFACALGKAVRVEPLKVTAIVVPSLCDMLQEPELKAQTWKSIQPLRQR